MIACVALIHLQELWAAEHIKRSELIKFGWIKEYIFLLRKMCILILIYLLAQVAILAVACICFQARSIGKNCRIQEFSSIESSTIGDNCDILPHTIIKDSSIGTNINIGPFAHIREYSHIGENVVLGNFVEVKKSTIGKGTTAKHLAYLGDAIIGANVNIGAGTITCNYNGLTKHQTIIKDNAFIGSNNTLIAPVTIETDAYTAAGSVISENVPAEALAISRARQVNKEGYARQLMI